MALAWTFSMFSPKTVPMMSASPPSAVRPRYLVVQLARFGDLIQTKRLLLSLRARGEAHLVVDASLAPLARLVYPEVQIHGLPAHGAYGPDVLGRAHAGLAVLAGLEFTRIHNLNFSGLNFALAAMFPATRVLGYRMRAGQRLIDLWPALAMRWTKKRAQADLNLVDLWGLSADEPMPPAEVNPSPRPAGGGLGVVMAGQNARRSLPPHILAPLVRAAVNRVGHGPVYLLGAGAERRAATELASLLPPSLRAEVRDLVGRTGWPELIETVAGLDLLLSPDTGTMHLAAHLGVPVLAFFLSSAWCHETGPYGAGQTVVQALPDCAPCLETAPCPCGVRCRTPFADPALVRFVGGREDKDIPAGLAIMRAAFDDAGLIFRPVAGTDPRLAQRACFRSQATRVAGVGTLPDPCGPEDGLDWWIQERDWMLPQTLRGRHV